MINREIFFNIAQIYPKLKLANPQHNAEEIIKVLEDANVENTLIQFPPLALTGISCANFFTSNILLTEVKEAVKRILKYSEKKSLIFNIGFPFMSSIGLVAIECLVYKGEIIALDNYRDFSSSKGKELKSYFEATNVKLAYFSFDNIFLELTTQLNLQSHIVLRFPHNICNFDLSGCQLYCQVSTTLNISSNNLTRINVPNLQIYSLPYESYPKNRAFIENNLSSLSCQNNTIAIAMTAGSFESSSDLSYRGLLAYSQSGETKLNYEKLGYDLDKQSALLTNSFMPSSLVNHSNLNSLTKLFNTQESDALFNLLSVETLSVKLSSNNYSFINPLPFLPVDKNKKIEQLTYYIENNISALARRLELLSYPKIIIGLSGGLDSTVALLSSALCLIRLNINLNQLLAVRMPGMGSSLETQDNSSKLVKALACDDKLISIIPAIKQHFIDIDHKEDDYDIAYENSQARERTQILMDLANMQKGLVIGTGDLSEIALGWSTYNGDHMSMYAINSSIPKTMMPDYLKVLITLLKLECKKNTKYSIKFDELLKAVDAVINVPISPELLPLNEDESKNQKTEVSIGPYLLHDFFIYYKLSENASYENILQYATEAFSDKNINQYLECNEIEHTNTVTSPRSFKLEEIDKYLAIFKKRFRNNQFKRSVMPEAAAATEFSFSPRQSYIYPGDCTVDL